MTKGLFLLFFLMISINSLQTGTEVIHNTAMLEDYRMRIKLTTTTSDTFIFRINFPVPAVGSNFPQDFFARIYTGTWNNQVAGALAGTGSIANLYSIPAAGTNLDLTWTISVAAGTEYWF